jgi:hypothetical protein
MTPPQLHINLDEFCSAGIPPIITVGHPGAQGAAVTGIQGIGVSTPNAAAVAAITMGLAGQLHMPNGGTFIIGLLSMMLAAGAPAITRFAGNTDKTLGATPKLHCRVAPAATCIPIASPSPKVQAFA